MCLRLRCHAIYREEEHACTEDDVEFINEKWTRREKKSSSEFEGFIFISYRAMMKLWNKKAHYFESIYTLSHHHHYSFHPLPTTFLRISMIYCSISLSLFHHINHLRRISFASHSISCKKISSFIISAAHFQLFLSTESGMGGVRMKYRSYMTLLIGAWERERGRKRWVIEISVERVVDWVFLSCHSWEALLASCSLSWGKRVLEFVEWDGKRSLSLSHSVVEHNLPINPYLPSALVSFTRWHDWELCQKGW
jgi:hypothetical protein